MAQNIAVIGLGAMGYGMASSCLRAGHRTYGFDISPEPVARFREEGGAPGSLADVAQ
ncbi:MAG: NAD(P)-binding domain-containing protein, partial [Pseudomonadota bacterium]